MKRQTVQRAFAAPLRIDWTDEKLRALDQEQLLNLLDNLAQQLEGGRLAPENAEAIERRIVALLTPRNAQKRRRAAAG